MASSGLLWAKTGGSHCVGPSELSLLSSGEEAGWLPQPLAVGGWGCNSGSCILKGQLNAAGAGRDPGWACNTARKGVPGAGSGQGRGSQRTLRCF